MGKVSAVFILLLMVNLIGYIVVADYATAYPATAGTSFNNLTTNNPLLQLYTPNPNTGFNMDNSSSIFVSVPSKPTEDFLRGITVFLDRIFLLFDWVRVMVAIAVFPVTLITMLGLPFQLSMLLGIPLATLYIFGIIDIFSSAGT